jgi:hypothetical protein
MGAYQPPIDNRCRACTLLFIASAPTSRLPLVDTCCCRLAEERTADVQVCVYEYTDMEKLATLDCGTELRYSALALSACGRYLLAVGDAPDYVLTVWDWQADVCLLRTTVPERLVGGGVSFSTAPGTTLYPSRSNSP